MPSAHSSFGRWLARSVPAAACPAPPTGPCAPCAALCLAVAGQQDDIDTLREMLRLRDAQVMGLRKTVRDLEARLDAARGNARDRAAGLPHDPRFPGDPDWTAPSGLLPRAMR